MDRILVSLLPNLAPDARQAHLEKRDHPRQVRPGRVPQAKYFEIEPQGGRIVLTPGAHWPRRCGARKTCFARHPGSRCWGRGQVGAASAQVAPRAVFDTVVVVPATLLPEGRLAWIRD